MGEVAKMLDDDYNLKINSKKDKPTLNLEKIEELGRETLKLVKSDEEKADFHKCLALSYQNKGKYSKALREWENLSKLPNGSLAFNRMGILHSGMYHGVKKDIPTALKYFRMAAKKGDINSAFNVALTYDKMRSKAV